MPMNQHKRKGLLTSAHRRYLKKHKTAIIIAAVVLLILTLYVGGVIGQMRILPGENYTYTFNIVKCIIYNFTVTPIGTILVMFFYALLGWWLYKRYKDRNAYDTEKDERGFDIEHSGTYGTDRLIDSSETRDFCEIDKLERVNGMIIGKISSPDGNKKNDVVVSVPVDGCRYKYDSNGNLAIKKDENGNLVPVRERLPKIIGNRHIIVCGPSGSGKSFCFARPAIFQSIKAGESYLVTDPKGELFQDTSRYAQEHGYVVKIFNLLNTAVSDSWNILAEIMDEDDIVIAAQQMTNIIIVNTQEGMEGAQPIFVDGPKNLLTAAILCVLQSPSWVGERTLAGVYDLLTYDDDTIGAFMDGLPANHPGKKHWANYLSASPNLRGNIKTGMSTRLQIMSSDVIRAITSITDIDLLLPGKAKCAYYIIMDDMNSTYKVLSSLFFSCLFNRLVKYSRTLIGGKLPVSVNIIMDEFIAIGKLPDFDKKLAMVRSAGISCSIIFQTLAQLQKEYPDGLWETLISNCSTMLYLACNDLTSAEYMSTRSGVATIATESTRVERPLIDVLHIPTEVSHSYALQKREVLTLTEIMRQSADHKVIISIAGANLMLAESFPYTDLVDPKTLTKVNIMDHVPAWRMRSQYETSSAFTPYASAPSTPAQRYQPKPHSANNDEIPDTKDNERVFIEDKTNEDILQNF